MRTADAFDGTAFLGMARESKRDPYRLSLFAAHLEPDESPLVLLPVQGGTLLVTDRRVLEFRAHLEVHGAWNVKEFQGYEVRRELPRASVSQVDRRVDPASSGPPAVVDRLLLTTDEGTVEFVVSRGPVTTLSEEDAAALRRALLGPQAK